MVGADLVRDFRDKKSTENPARRFSIRTIFLLACAAICALAFGSILVKAGDDSGIYDTVRSSANGRPFARTTPFPQIFASAPRPVVRTSLSYAPIFDSLAPRGLSHDPLAPQPKASAPRREKSSAARKVSDKDFAEGVLNSRMSYCVRTCDGYFFPVGNPDTGSLGAHEAVCDRMCPAAETAVYVAPAGSKGIEDAVDRKGARYESIRTAFNHRTQYDKACSCSGNGVGVGRNYSVMTDFTLRDGDYIMSREGIKVFRNKDQFPHRKDAFAKADLSKLGAAERKALESLEASSTRGNGSTIVPPGLRARISAQVNAGKPSQPAAPLVQAALAGQSRKTNDGKDRRYVGPDVDYDRGR